MLFAVETASNVSILLIQKMLINFCETKVVIDFYNKVETEFVESLKISDFFLSYLYLFS